MQHLLPNTTLQGGKYRIDRVLGQGDFGNTYVGYNTEFEETVAIKEFFMKGVTERDDNQTTVSVSNIENHDSFLEQREKFKKEARRIRQLNNPHIVRVHDLFEENGTAYYVMDYVDGENLNDRLKRTGKPMTEREVHEILPQILDALKSVHYAGIWHLDLKPANIMVDKTGIVKLIDFGASKLLNTQKGGATTSTAISYTNGYAPREQMEQNYDKFGPWTDIYALGATLYNLLTNKRPPLPTDIDDDMSEDKHHALPMSTNVSYFMKKLVLWLMQTNRSKRPQSVAEILSNIQLLRELSTNANEEEETIVVSPENEKTIQTNKDTNKIIPSHYKLLKEGNNRWHKWLLTSFLLGFFLLIGLYAFVMKTGEQQPQYLEVDSALIEEVSLNPKNRVHHKVHILQKGEFLTGISEEYYGTKDSVSAILRLNNFKNPDVIPPRNRNQASIKVRH